MDGGWVSVLGFVVLFLLMLLRVPIGVAMGLVGIGGFALMNGWGPALKLLSHVPIRTVTDYNLSLIPLFILMGAFASASGMSRELFTASYAWLGHRRGGLAMATVAACGGFAAICGSSVATAATMGQVALPEMRRFGYSDRISTGVIAAGGTLGILIPPSVVLAIYGILTEQDIGKLFIAGVIPGVVALLLYMMTVQILAGLKPEHFPRGDRIQRADRWKALQGVWAVVALFMFVVGGIYGGVFTPTEAAGMGAAGAYLIAVIRRRINWSQTVECLTHSIRVSAGIFTILIGALLFGYFLTITQTPQRLTEMLTALPLGDYGTLILLLIFYLLLGCILDAMAMIILTVPIVYPIVLTLGFDPIWFGVIVVMTVELGLISPPVGMNVFVLKGTVDGVSLTTIYKGVLPFLIMDVVRLALFILFPALILYLPGRMG